MSGYGFDGNLTALDFLHLTGSSGVANLRPEDVTLLIEAGVLNDRQEVLTERLALAIQYRNDGYVVCDAVGSKKEVPSDALAAPHCQPFEKFFGLGPSHRFTH